MQTLAIELLFLTPKQITPFQCPEIRKLRPRQQLVHQPHPFFGCVTLHKRLHGFRRRNESEQIQIRTSNKGVITAQAGGVQTQVLKFPENMPIHKINLWRIRPSEIIPIRNKRQRHRHLPFQKAHQHRDLSKFKPLHFTRRRHLSIFIRCKINRTRRHILYTPIRKHSLRPNLDCGFRSPNDLPHWGYLQPRHSWRLLNILRHTRSDPISKHVVFGRSRRETFPAFMRDLLSGLA